MPPISVSCFIFPYTSGRKQLTLSAERRGAEFREPGALENNWEQDDNCRAGQELVIAIENLNRQRVSRALDEVGTWDLTNDNGVGCDEQRFVH
ncbi:unnamed protein product [Nezara viridula]|uniref:Uncharacterized protein n=1 Tax=Nezara viridula TaxID=85310 RepID=A0A9P0MTM6_NEZVI|nr:unnamed protein product [Nezara viridula]